MYEARQAVVYVAQVGGGINLFLCVCFFVLFCVFFCVFCFVFVVVVEIVMWKKNRVSEGLAV